jgi:gamma-glutamyltranspeptidase
MSPAASGLGGGHFMVIRSPNGTTEVIDAREPAPAAANETMFSGVHISLIVRKEKKRKVYAFQ